MDNNVNQSIRGDDFSFQGCEQPVSLNKLDSLSLFPENIPVVLIKIDVEGFEKEVLEGGIGLIVHNNYPPIIFETWEYDWYAEKKQIIFNFLENLGYVIQSLGMNNIAQHNTRNVIYFSIN